MTFCIYVNQITPHLVPLAQEAVRLLGEDSVRYVYIKALENERSILGWSSQKESWMINKTQNPKEADEWIEESDILICELRDLNLWERRAQSGKGMYYTSERWLKPIKNIFPGWLRLFSPKFFFMFRRAVRIFEKHTNLIYLADGYYAAEDMVKIQSFMHGRFWDVMKRPLVTCSKIPLDTFRYKSNNALIRMKMWGYFVSSTAYSSEQYKEMGMSRVTSDIVNILWVGRYLDWKRIDTLIKAVLNTPAVTLDLYGYGPDEHRLKRLASGSQRITFNGPVSVVNVRKLMRHHDVYVLPSNEYEGWGAVINEALEERMKVLGSFEAGASRAMLPSTNLFHSNDWRTLSLMLQNPIPLCSIGEWNVKIVIKKLISIGVIS